ncbi:hypothetical protein J3R83DRAFT_11197 [Lanmaoa asiatica]|nr:hypothetical protein J3R83DRAFT_11197 [Lanmaoa asiatica]
MSHSPAPQSSNTLLLRRQLTELTKRPVEGFSAGLVDDNNLYEWEVIIIGEGGFFKARLTFPTEYPLLPPKMRFLTPMWHPNIYPDGVVCISILHAPGDDQYGYEDAGERWMPVHTVETIVRFSSNLRVISLLSSDTPNTDSPANVDAAKEVRTDLAGTFLYVPGITKLTDRESLQEEGRARSAEGQLDVFSEIVGQNLAGFTGDLSAMTAPPFILSPTSLTEFPAYWCERPELFAKIVDGKTEEARALAVLRWFISTLKGQYTSRNESMGSEKKLFYGYWPETKERGGKTTLVVEQVSHHPPITAYRIANDAKGIVLNGHNAQKTSFSGGSIIVKQVGHAILTVALPSGGKEEYLITLPRLRIDGLWYGSPYIELADTSYIQGSNGWQSVVRSLSVSSIHTLMVKCQIEYKGKGYFSGTSHSFKATVTHPAQSSERVIQGTWHTTSTDKSTGATFHDVTTPKEEVTVTPVKEQGEWESRHLWYGVAKGIREGDFEAAAKEKSRIENEQRQRRRDEAAAGTTWALKHFEHIDNDPTYEHLAALFSGNPATEDTYVYLNNGPSASV